MYIYKYTGAHTSPADSVGVLVLCAQDDNLKNTHDMYTFSGPLHLAEPYNRTLCDLINFNTDSQLFNKHTLGLPPHTPPQKKKQQKNLEHTHHLIPTFKPQTCAYNKLQYNTLFHFNSQTWNIVRKALTTLKQFTWLKSAALNPTLL